MTNRVFNNDIYVLDNVMSLDEVLYIYERLQNSPNWTLTRTSEGGKMSASFSSFPGMVVETKGEIHHEYFSGYFRSLIYRVRKILKDEYSVILPKRIQRIHLGAKSSQSETKFHSDSKNKDAWSILGFLNPVWNVKDGGEFYVEEEKIDYKSARFVVFKSHLSHNGGFIKNDQLNYWRISLNVILQEENLSNKDNIEN